MLTGSEPVLVHNDDCPKYENNGHHDPNGGQEPYRPDKSVTPADAEEQFKNTILIGKARWPKIGKGKKAVYYRYCEHLNNVWHFCGSSNGRTLKGEPRGFKENDIPIEIKRKK